MHGVGYNFKGNLRSVTNKSIWLNRNLLLSFCISWKRKYTVLQLEKTSQVWLLQKYFPSCVRKNIEMC